MPHYFASYLIRFRLTGSVSLHRWLRIVWDSPAVRSHIETAAATSRPIQRQHPSSEWDVGSLPEKNIENRLPELEGQLSIADAVERTIDASLKRAERLRQAILKRAFEGRLVAQDPNDEPACLLLDRFPRNRAARLKTAGGLVIVSGQ